MCRPGRFCLPCGDLGITVILRRSRATAKRAAPSLRVGMDIRTSACAAASLAWREIIRFFRQRNRIVGSIGTPLVFWLLFGAGMASSFRVNAGEQTQTFLYYFFPGSLL